MANATKSHRFRPLNVFMAPHTAAADTLRPLAFIPEALAPGLRPTRAHDLIYHGGKTIPDLTFTNFYVGGAQVWSSTDMQNIDQALAAAMADTDLNNVMVQYFPAGRITSTFKPSAVLPDPAPATVSQGTIESIAQDLYAQGKLDGYDLTSTVFNFMLPRGIVLNDDPGPAEGAPQVAARNPALNEDDAVDSLHGLGGYHGSIHPARPDGTQETVYYAVGVYSEAQPDGQTNGIPVFDQSWKNVVATFYHEMNEVRTDADVEDAIKAGNDPSATKFLGWMSRQGEECGDFPVFEANPLTQVFQEVELTDQSGTVPVQFQYSNAVHGPEGPRDTPDHAQSTRSRRTRHAAAG